MATINPMQFLMSLRTGNPKDLAISMIQNNYANDSSMQELLNMAINNDTEGVNRFAEKYFSDRGLNLNNEMSKLMTTLKNL